ncbi:MAG: hypothetical protein Q9209_005034 [Squamulea sp. 1 TL-2023]
MDLAKTSTILVSVPQSPPGGFVVQQYDPAKAVVEEGGIFPASGLTDKPRKFTVIAMAGPTPADIQYQLQHIQEDRSNEIIVAFGICLGLAIITVLLRFVARHLTKASLGGDDWTIIFGLVGINYGLGRHAVVVQNPVSFAKVIGRQSSHEASLIYIHQAITASIVFYIVSLAATKVSILLLYRRIFPIRAFHAIIWAVGLFVVAFTIANVLSIVFSCRPINGAWTPFIKAKCINTEAAILAVAASVISIYRATVVAKVDQADISYQSTSRSIWSGVEICIAIVCANLATLRPLLNYVFTGKALSTAKSGPTSGTTASGTSTKSRLRWTWRHVAVPPHQATKVSNDGTFHRLEQHPGEQSTDDVEMQKFEDCMMSPISSLRIPETGRF